MLSPNIVKFPSRLNGLYHRKITKIKAENINKCSLRFPFQVNSDNNILVDNRIIKSQVEFDHMMRDLQPNEYIYVSPVSIYANRYRIFIDDDEIVHVANISHHFIRNRKISPNSPPQHFMLNILDNVRYSFCVIDVGLKMVNRKMYWTVIEVKAPFKLKQYGVDSEFFNAYYIRAQVYYKNNT